jgi:general secretion pathway protein E
MDPRSEPFVNALSDALLATRLADEAALARARRAQATTGARFDTVLSELGIVPERPLAEAIAGLIGLPLAALDQLPEAPLLADVLPPDFLARARLLPLALTDTTLTLAMADPFNDDAVNAIAYLTSRSVDRAVLTGSDFEIAYARLYDTSPRQARLDTDGGGTSDGADADDIERLKDIASEAPVIRFVGDMIARAVERRASDIHVEPLEDHVRVRFRKDGRLEQVDSLPRAMHAAVTSRIKIMARLNIAERRLPQDGRLKLAVRGRDIDFRVSTMPSLYGESVVLRVLDRSAISLDFPSLGFAPDVEAAFRALLAQPNGIILVTGPTGSGKTTTLYTALSVLNRIDRKIFTVEDPIEYQLPGINQVQVQPRIGLTFAATLRSMLRQDPDIIMIGEIRDLETAEIAVQASLTGHLVLSTLHTNSAAASVTRLLDMGVEPFLLASTLRGVLAQRLVRKLCPKCGVPARRVIGCAHCGQTGFAGRTSIMELLTVTQPIRDGILTRRDETGLEAAAMASGMRRMYDDGARRVERSETTLEEVLLATQLTS